MTADTTATPDDVATTTDGTLSVRTPRGVLHIDPEQPQFTAEQRLVLAEIGMPVTGPDAVAPGALLLLLHLCEVRGFDPWCGDVTLMRDSTTGGWVPVVKFQALLQKANETGEFGGFGAEEWLDDDGEGFRVWPRSAGRPYGAKAEVHRTGYAVPSAAIVYTEEVEVWEQEWYAERDPKTGAERRRYTGGRQRAARWRDDGQVRLMVMKCARAAALRLAFPEALSGLYLPEEMGRMRAERRRAERESAERAARDRIREHREAAGETLEGVVVDRPTPSRREQMQAVQRLREAAMAPSPDKSEPESEPEDDAAPESSVALPLPETAAERAECLRDELREMAAILGVELGTLTRRMPSTLADADADVLARYVMPLRGTVAAALRRTGRHAEAAVYADWADTVASPDVLFGRLAAT